MDMGLLSLRLTVGLTFAAHDTQKLFGWFGGLGLDGTGQFFVMLGSLLGRRHALMAGLAETGGGLLLAFGLLAPVRVWNCRPVTANRFEELSGSRLRFICLALSELLQETQQPSAAPLS